MRTWRSEFEKRLRCLECGRPVGEVNCSSCHAQLCFRCCPRMLIISSYNGSYQNKGEKQ